MPAAREQLEAVQLPAGPGISLGTQQYLLGLAYEGEGDAASAQRSFQAAAASGGLLTEDGPADQEPRRAQAERRVGAARPHRDAERPRVGLHVRSLACYIRQVLSPLGNPI